MAAANPLMRIRAGIEAGNVKEVLAGVADADKNNVTLAANVRDMITQWLSANAPEVTQQKQQAQAAPVGRSSREADAADAAEKGQRGTKRNGSTHADDEGVRLGSGGSNWNTTDGFKVGKTEQSREVKLSAELLRLALMKFFKGAPKGSDAAGGLGIIEGEDGKRFLPLPLLGKACGLTGEDFQVYQAVWTEIDQAPKGIFALSSDARGAGLVEWAGWDDFQQGLSLIHKGTRDPAFEPRSIQAHVLLAARGAVRSGHVRQADVLRGLGESLDPQDMPEDAAPALKTAISRRTRLALGCVVDAIASFGLGPEAGPDAMGLVGQLPRSLFGYLFDKIDDRDRGACAFLGEMLQQWDKRRCFSKRWLQDAAGKFSMPKGANAERDEGRGWYALTSENIGKKAPEDVAGKKPDGAADEPMADAVEAKKPADVGAVGDKGPSPPKDVSKPKKRLVVQDEENDDEVKQRLEESRKRRANLMQKYRDEQD